MHSAGIARTVVRFVAMLRWLSSYNHGAHRFSSQHGDDGNTQQIKRKRLTLPKETWISERFSSKNIKEPLDMPERNCILGLAVVEVGMFWKGFPTPLSREAKVLFHYYLQPSDGIVLNVVRYYDLTHFIAYGGRENTLLMRPV